MRDSSLSEAASLPLPESRAGTPSLPADGIKINGISKAHAHIGDGVPSRTASPASGAPPPVPRRAAARNKGGVGVVSGDETLEKNQVGSTTGDGGKMAEEGGVAVVKEEKAGSRSASGEVVGAVRDGMGEKTDGLVEGGGSNDALNGIVKTVEEEKEGRTQEEEEERTEKTLLPDTTGVDLIESSSTSDNAKVDQTEYVGTSTWEDKTWRELVRIRKDMFHARLGAVNF
jgi:hypothetical protein